MRSSTARASSMRPLTVSQRGLSGMPSSSNSHTTAGHATQAQHPAPGVTIDAQRLHPGSSGLAHIQQKVVGEVGRGKADHDVELVERHHEAALLGGRDLRDVHRRNAERGKRETADEARGHQRLVVGRNRGRRRGKRVQRGEHHQHALAADQVAEQAAADRGGDAGQRRCAHDQTHLPFVQAELGCDEADHAGDHATRRARTGILRGQPQSPVTIVRRWASRAAISVVHRGPCRIQSGE